MYIYELDDYDDVIEVMLVDIELNENTLVFYIQTIVHSYMQNDDFEDEIWIDDLTEIEAQIIDEDDAAVMITDEVDDELDDDEVELHEIDEIELIQCVADNKQCTFDEDEFILVFDDFTLDIKIMSEFCFANKLCCLSTVDNLQIKHSVYECTKHYDHQYTQEKNSRFQNIYHCSQKIKYSFFNQS